MNARGIYDSLMEGRNSFDAHVVACSVALAMEESLFTGRAVTEFIGLAGADLLNLLRSMFPVATHFLQPTGWDSAITVQDDERCLVELLTRYSTCGSNLEVQLAAMIARRAMQPNHLWQDLGLRNRSELSQLMRLHFAPLAARNSSDMKWKKFLYRMICRDEGYRLCTTPICSECDDFAVCFGDESGESLLARNRRSAPDGLVHLTA
jgi:nitrogen fixation protein NifQ